MSAIFDRSAFYDGDLYSTKNSTPALSQSQGCFKWTLLAANLLFLIFAVILMAVGAYALNNPVGALSGQTIPNGIIAMGVFIMLVALLGGLAAWLESRGFLGLYFVVLAVLTIILFAVGIAVYVEQNNAATYIDSGWRGANRDFKISLQIAFNCCGLKNYNDSDALGSQPCPGFPWGTTPPPSQVGTIDVGCEPALISAFTSSMTTAGGCGIGFAVVMMVGMAFVCFLMDGIKKKRLEQDLATLRQSNDVAVENVPIPENTAEY